MRIADERTNQLEPVQTRENAADACPVAASAPEIFSARSSMKNLDPKVFRFTPVSFFKVWERRSLTVHLEDAGMFDVSCDEGDIPSFAGRYATYREALEVAGGLNAVWRACGSATSAEVLAFVTKTPLPNQELVEALVHSQPWISKVAADHDGDGTGLDVRAMRQHAKNASILANA